MFAVPQGEDETTQVEGLHDTNPITLDNVTKDDFRYLMDLIMPLDIPPTEPELSKEPWVAILGLATMWEMCKIRSHCIDKLTNMAMSAVERAVLAKKFHVPQWLRTAYTELVDQGQTLSISDSSSIGYRSAVGVFQLREQRHRRSYGYYHYPEQNVTLESVFEEELAEEEAIFQTYCNTDTTSSVTEVDNGDGGDSIVSA
ncbi:hypothetical protein C0992_004720 [Termitomyces sp. T32_za158]|nr:hypothetical protein C0992_004720 [Termitomyces sp. T32_za158]